MAVLEAVRGWEQLAGLPHINDVRKAEANGEELPVVKEEENEAESKEDEDEWKEDELEMKIKELERADFESLLVEHEKHVGGEVTESQRKSMFVDHLVLMLTGALSLRHRILSSSGISTTL
jgi:hypothetical protein